MRAGGSAPAATPPWFSPPVGKTSRRGVVARHQAPYGPYGASVHTGSDGPGDGRENQSGKSRLSQVYARGQTAAIVDLQLVLVHDEDQRVSTYATMLS